MVVVKDERQRNKYWDKIMTKNIPLWRGSSITGGNARWIKFERARKRYSSESTNGRWWQSRRNDRKKRRFLVLLLFVMILLVESTGAGVGFRSVVFTPYDSSRSGWWRCSPRSRHGEWWVRSLEEKQKMMKRKCLAWEMNIKVTTKMKNT